jgi:branched-chain amino acid transport system substrate-binding protein
MQAGGDSWFFMTADYALGHALERDTTAVILAAGGRVAGSVRHPLNTSDFSSFLLQAQAAHVKIVALANAGADTINAIKQAGEFGVNANGTKLAALLAFITDIHSLGLKTAQGLILTEAFYWDLNDGTREFSKRFAERANGRAPSQIHAGAYSATIHYLKAVEALKSKAALPVIAKMKAMPTDDPLFGKGSIREDGRKMHPMYLFEVKKPEESKAPWDYYKLLATIPAEEAFRPLAEGNCPFVSK